jgi:hypothetical protein
MAAPTNATNVKKVLSNLKPSTHGSKRTWAGALQISAFGGEADMMQTGALRFSGFTVQEKPFSARERR